MNFRSVYLPNLQVLVLGKYTFRLRYQFERILEHAQSITKLYLWDCRILFGMDLFDEDIEYGDEARVMYQRDPKSGRRMVMFYARQWADLLNRIM